MTVERQWLATMPIDSWAQLSADTVIGDKYVDITSGASRTLLAPNATVIYRDNPDIMKRLDLTQFRKQLEQVDAVLVETVFARPGIGRYLTTALFAADTPAILGSTLTIGACFVLINGVTDLLVRVLDPRSA